MPKRHCKEIKEARTKKAVDMAEAAKNRTPKEQVVRLDDRLGTGLGAKKERAKLQATIDRAVKKVVEEISKVDKEVKKIKK